MSELTITDSPDAPGQSSPAMFLDYSLDDPATPSPTPAPDDDTLGEAPEVMPSIQE